MLWVSEINEIMEAEVIDGWDLLFSCTHSSSRGSNNCAFFCGIVELPFSRIKILYILFVPRIHREVFRIIDPKNKHTNRDFKGKISDKMMIKIIEVHTSLLTNIYNIMWRLLEPVVQHYHINLILFCRRFYLLQLIKFTCYSYS